MPSGISSDAILKRLAPQRWPLQPHRLPNGTALVGGAIRENLSSTYSSQEKKLQEENKPSPGQCETSSKIQRILDEKINPGVAQHGGRIGFVKYENQRVYITMEGGCQGCSMSKVTLKSGVERSLQEEIPELLEVVDVTDHSQGANPYHS